LARLQYSQYSYVDPEMTIQARAVVVLHEPKSKQHTRGKKKYFYRSIKEPISRIGDQQKDGDPFDPGRPVIRDWLLNLLIRER
jgi:hypothetical protein